MINPGVVAAIRVVGVRGDPCGAMRWATVQCIAPQGSPRTPTTRIAATTPGLIIRILNSVFFKIVKLFSNCNEIQTYSLMMMIC
jgi:hypothetical protein